MDTCCSLGDRKKYSERIEMRHVFSYLTHHWLLLRMLFSTLPNWWEQEFVRRDKSSHHSQENWWHEAKHKHSSNLICYLRFLDTAPATPRALRFVQSQRWEAPVPLGSWFNWCTPWATGHQHNLPAEPLAALSVPCPSISDNGDIHTTQEQQHNHRLSGLSRSCSSNGNRGRIGQRGYKAPFCVLSFSRQ